MSGNANRNFVNIVHETLDRPCTGVHYACTMRNKPLESHGVRLSSETWRKIERLAEADDVDRTTWLREQVEALVSRTPDVHTTQAMNTTAHVEFS